MNQRAAHAPEQNRLLGILLRIGAASSFAFMGAMIKLAYDARLDTAEIAFWRFAFGLPPLLLWIGASRNFQVWRTSRPLAHVSRAALGLTTLAMSFSALSYLPLAEATTIGFAAPLFAVMLSALVLKEPVGWHRWSAVALGIAGVLLVMRPAGSHLPAVGLVLALLAALGTGVVAITLRQIGRTEGTQTIVLWFTLLSMFVTGLFLPFHAHPSRIWLILLALGTFGGLGQLLMTASLRFAPVPVIVPFDYMQLLWAVLLGWAIFAARPLPSTWAGAAIIVASGLYTIYREHRLGRDRKTADAPL